MTAENLEYLATYLALFTRVAQRSGWEMNADTATEAAARILRSEQQ